MRVTVISDTHSMHDSMRHSVEETDILIHSGDFTGGGEIHKVIEFFEWINKQPTRHIIVTPGNHELGMERDQKEQIQKLNDLNLINNGKVHLLINESITIEGIKIFGTPYTPYFNNWAWNKNPEDLKTLWGHLIPDDVNILIVHGPPYGILDQIDEIYNPVHLGCPSLADRINEIRSLKLICFGHIHGGYGIKRVLHKTYINGSICTEAYRPTNKPITYIYDDNI